ncbi:MAG: hypothetical protein IKV17_07880 [Bacteroidaceae bacterium]|nr:hypothetical protein [Bacteroidaceae bacterium]
MNKFLKRAKGDRKNTVAQKKTSLTVNDEDLQALEQFANDWFSLEEMRRKDRRSTMYAWDDQWGDLVKDPDTGNVITERELIMKQGKVPLKNNMIAPILNNIEGQLRTATTKPVCAVRDQREAKLGEMMTVAIEYVHDLNEITEVDVASLKSACTSGLMVQRIEYGVNPAKGNKNDVWVYPVNQTRVFFDTSFEDVRTWDISRIGEIYDMSIDDVIANFGKYVSEEELKRIYGNNGYIYRDSYALNGDKLKNMGFYTPTHPDMCRVILGWRLENRPAIFFHDNLKGEYGYVEKKEKGRLDEINRLRREEARANGVDEEDILYIDYEEATERKWVYRYLTPWGHCLAKGDSPYWHGGHNFVLGVLHFVKGRLYNFVEQFIDQQRSINRTAMMIDFIRSASSKGLLIINEDAFDSMTREEIVDEYVRYNGVLFVKPKQGVNVRDVVHQLNGAASTAGDYELLNLQLKLINEISGVNSAMQGQAPKAGTPSSLYAMQTQNSSLNLKGLFGAMNAFKRRRDVIVMKTIQQFYNDNVYLNIAGKDYSEEAKRYNPEKVKNAEIDLAITDGNNTPAYQMMANDFLMQLFQSGAIRLNTLLENSSYPFAAKILESVKRDEQAQQEVMQAMQQYAPRNEQMAMAMDNSNAGAMDGIIQKA